MMEHNGRRLGRCRGCLVVSVQEGSIGRYRLGSANQLQVVAICSIYTQNFGVKISGFCRRQGFPIPFRRFHNMAEKPMTKLWYTNPKTPYTISTPQFRRLWTEVLDFCFSASGSTSSGHTLWQDISSHDNLVMISGYPSYGSNQAADKAYAEDSYMKRVAEFVEYRRLLQIDMDVNALIPAGLGHKGGFYV